MSYPDPKYTGTQGEASAVLRRAGQPFDLEMGHGGSQVHYLATGARTKGEFGLYRWDFSGPPSGPGAHFHKTLSESFCVLSGTVRPSAHRRGAAGVHAPARHVLPVTGGLPGGCRPA